MKQEISLVSKMDNEIKLKLFADNPINTFNSQAIFKFKVAGLWIQINYQGCQTTLTLEFLQKYFIHFEQKCNFDESSDIIIHYRQLEDEHGSSLWKYWNEWDHEIEFIPQKNNGYNPIVARDFVGLLDNGKKEIFVIGPELSFDTCDSIDNVISYMIGHHLLERDGVILHAACTVFSGQAYVFFGASGVGKSTIAEFSQRKYGHGVIGSDQVIVRYVNNSLHAELMPTTIPEFSLHHPARILKPTPIRGMFHLVKSNEDFNFKELNSENWIKLFMRELVYRNEFKNEAKLLDLSLKIAKDPGIVRAEMSYKKESDFFTKLHEILRIRGESYERSSQI